VDEVEVGVVEAQARQRGLAGGADAGRREVVVPDLGGDEERAAGRPDAARAAPTSASLPYISAVSTWR
jgi:hypothetical protein